MKKSYSSKKMYFCLLVLLGLAVAAFTSCNSDDVGDNYVTATEDLIGEYLGDREDCSEFYKMLDTTGVLGLLNAYGQYTCFIPDNDAVNAYYKKVGKTSINDFSVAELKKICYNHIIKGDTIKSSDFSEGALSTQSMSERYISIAYSTVDGTILVNGVSPIIERDIKLHNGYVHILSQFLQPSEMKLAEKFAQDTIVPFTIYSDALIATGYADIINNTPVEDVSFDPEKDQRSLMTHTVLEERPKSRKIGYTIIAVSDKNLASYTECPACPNGVHSVDDLEKVAKYYYSQVYSDGESVTNRKDKKNYLNRFMAYHCFDRTLLSTRFISDFFTPHHFKQYAMHEYIPTMLENSLLEVKLDKNVAIGRSDLGQINSMEDPTKAVLFTDYVNKPDGGALNGYYHEITKPVIYSKEFIADISSKRLRMDGSSFFSELATNNMRGNNPTAVAAVVGKTHAYLLPNGYLNDMKASENTRFTYIGACVAYEDYQGDELYLIGTYNFSIKTSPIPAGTYEIRMGYQPTAYRGIAQLYWDSVPCGIPLNLSLYATDPEIGYVTPGTDHDDPDGYENDKMMHNRGYMKGPSSYYCYGHWYSYSAATARLSSQSLRRVLGTYTFTETKRHTLTVISLGSTSSSTQFMMDYLEFVPTELLESEDIE
jgi:uncharacterized surface protein with fasciclin (FAS1) repeats